MIKVAVDAMGGDNAPHEIVEGALSALNGNENINIVLLGNQEAEKCIPNDFFAKDRLTFVETKENIEMAENPVRAIRQKKDSSLVVGFNMLKNKEVDAFVSAGNTGAVLAGGQFIAGTIPGVKRSPLAPLLPTKRSHCLLVDCGANVDAKPEYLLQFAIMGSIYMESILQRKNPKVALVNIGTEKEKGNALVKAAYPLLEGCKSINFVGNIEARDIPKGEVDIVVCEAFTGNVLLKTYEGVSTVMMDIMKEAFIKNTITKIGALMVKKSIKDRLKVLLSSENGGAPLLGLNGLVVKVHGNATRAEIKNSILQCELFTKQNVTEIMREMFSGNSYI